MEYFSRILHSQMEAALCMLDDCLRKCPPENWADKIASYPFWQVAYHTLCFADLYLSPDEATFEFRPIHPKGWDEFNEEFPSRRFEKNELIEYLAEIRRKSTERFSGETMHTLESASGFARLKFTRGELHVYNIRHIQHHTGQLSAFLRKMNVDARWIGAGWKSAEA